MSKLKEFFKSTVINTPTKGEVVTTIVIGVPEIQPSKNPQSAKVTIKPGRAENGLGGYYIRESNVGKVIEKAADEGHQIIMRVEKIRKDGIDINIPIAELTPDMGTARKNVINSLTGIYDVNNNKWILNGVGHSNPDEDTQEMKDVISVALAGYAGEVNVDDFFKPRETTPNIPKPIGFDYQNAVTTMYYHVIELEKKYGYELKDDVRKVITKKLIGLADELQKVIRRADVIDYSDYSHTRARFLIFNYETHVSNLDKKAMKDLSKWIKENYEFNKNLLNWTIESI